MGKFRENRHIRKKKSQKNGRSIKWSTSRCPYFPTCLSDANAKVNSWAVLSTVSSSPRGVAVVGRFPLIGHSSSKLSLKFNIPVHWYSPVKELSRYYFIILRLCHNLLIYHQIYRLLPKVLYKSEKKRHRNMGARYCRATTHM